LAAAAAITAMSGCGDAKVAGGGATGGSSGSGGGGGGRGGGGGPGPGTDGPVFEVSAPETPPGGAADADNGAVCGEVSITAQRTPVDLLLLVDASDSMSAMGAGVMMSKYQLVRQALLRFARDPASAGLGIGVQFFPLPGPGSSCQTDADCGYVNPPTTPPCQAVTACADSVAAGPTRECRGGCGGSTCVPLGRCTKSLLDCTNLGQACPGGMAGDTCAGLGKACGVFDGVGSCTQTAYEQPFVPIATLPTPGERLLTWGMSQRYPSGGTPLRPAVAGAMTFFRRHLAQNAGRKGVMVLASDGAPSPGCPNNTVAAAAEVLSQARMPGGMPTVDTYVVGVYTPADATERMALETLATAGGTGMPLVIAPTEDLNQRFFETLNRIRGQSLPCELLIPPPKPGAGPLDLGRVNLVFSGVAGVEDVLYTGSAARCDPVRGGWYYDADPATGGMPTKVIVCEATCKKWKGDAKASVELTVGCRTRVID
jgi:hypothetical protein